MAGPIGVNFMFKATVSVALPTNHVILRCAQDLCAANQTHSSRGGVTIDDMLPGNPCGHPGKSA